jgi:phosphate-selective porin OprO/OprP
LLSEDSGFNFRSLRSGVIKLFNNGMIVKLDVDLTDGDSNFTDMYVRFSTKLGLITLGNQKVALSLVNQTSRLARTFMEEPLPAEAFGLVRRLGAGWDFHRKRVGVHLTAFGPDLNERIGKFGYGIRMYTNPTKTRWSLAHVGVSGVRESMDHDARFRARPESRVTNTFLVDTGKDADVDKQSIFSLEMAFAHKNWAIRGEYFYTEWNRKTQEDTNFSGYYLQANWVLTGESFQYKQGRFLRIRPDSSRGAWEVALRFSAVNLNDQDIFGGAERNTTLALNWYSPGNQLRIQSNLIWVKTDAVAGNEDPLIFQVRAQIHW